VRFARAFPEVAKRAGESPPLGRCGLTSGLVVQVLKKEIHLSSFGNLVHFSIPVSDVDISTKFYGELFGWKFKKMTPTYWLVVDGSAALSLENEHAKGSMPIIYFSVQNIDESLETATNNGAKVIVPKKDAGDGKSFFATFSDPHGNTIGLWSTNEI